MKLLYHNILILVFCIVAFTACNSSKNINKTEPAKNTNTSTSKVFTKPLNINRNEFINYAKTFIGTPYKYGSTDPKNGLDCSGFITIVFKKFNVKVPRASKDYTNEGINVKLNEAKPGDIILFTSSDNSSGIVGHMGIVTENKNPLIFISATSSKNIGVIESKLSGYWKTHFVKIIRLL